MAGVPVSAGISLSLWEMPCNIAEIEYTCKSSADGIVPGSFQIFGGELTDENSNVHTAWFL